MNVYKMTMVVCWVALTVSMEAVGAEKKPVTNADVVTMIKAGLPESTIVMAIKQGSSAFDTSPAGLIELKNQGATSVMLEAMMQPQPSTEMRPDKKGTGNPLLDAYGEQMSSSGEVVMLDSANRIAMKYATLKVEGRGKANVVASFVPFAPSKVYMKLDGQKSECRIERRMPGFEFGMDRDVKPETRVALIKFAARRDDRVIQTLSGTIAGASSGFPKERILSINIKEIKSDNNTRDAGQARYEASLAEPLAPGEYALVFDQYKAYDFGVDVGPAEEGRDVASPR